MLTPMNGLDGMGHAGPMINPVVPGRPVRRRFSAEYELGIVEEAAAGLGGRNHE